MKKILLTILCTLLSTMSWAQGTTAGDETSSEAYAVLMSGENNDITATLYYDENRNSHTEGFATVGMDELMQSQAWSMNRENITTVTIDSSFANYRPTSTSFWFAYCRSLTTISGLDHLNTEAVTDMSFMFNYCAALTSLDLSFFNTENVTNFAGMLGNCSSLTSIDLSSFYTRQATDMNSMFEQSSSLVTINLSSFNTSQVTNMSYMFNECSALTTIYVGSDWSTESVTNSENMFKACTNLVGGAGTTFNSEYITATYARIDGGTDNPGYFTDKNATPVGNAEPYAVLSDNNTVLTFYYDSQKTARGGIDINTTLLLSNSPYGSATTAVFDSSFANYSPTSTAYWFMNCFSLTAISNIGYLNTSNVTNMEYMFYGCSGLTSLDVSGFNTANVTSMYGMFYGCFGLTSLDVSGFSTANVTDMDSMFDGCSGLTSLDVSGFSTANVTDMGGMFRGCSGLTSLDVSNFNTANVTDMGAMFNRCSGLTSLDVSRFNTANVKYMYHMFSGCSGLTSLNVSGFNTANVTTMNDMFSGCSGLTSLDVSGFNTANVTDMSYMFFRCSGLTSLDVSGFNTANVTDMSYMFYYCSGLTRIYASIDWTTTAVTEGGSMFTGCTNLVGGAGTTYSADHVDHTYAHIDGGTDNPGYFTDKNAAPFVAVEPYAVLSENNTVVTFYYDDQKTARGGVDINNSLTNHYKSATTVIFDTSFANYRPESTAYWFNGLKDLETFIGLEYLNTSNVTSFKNMFKGCASLTNLDLSGFDTSKVTDMTQMFEDCSSLKNLNLRNFNTDSATNMGDMFCECFSLESLDLSSFNTVNVTKMSYMFAYCSSLKTLDLSSFNTANVTNMEGMFHKDSLLTTIYVGESWSTANVSSEEHDEAKGTMFQGCIALVGGAGTVYDANHIDYTYAHIDGGENNPGYFTAKNAAGTFDIRVSVYGNGEVSVGNLPDVIVDGKSAVASVDAGGSLEMFFFPLDGYQIGSVVLDNNDVTAFVTPATEYAAASYILNDINASHDITVTFTAKEGSGVVAPEFRFEGDNLTMSTTTQNASIFYNMAELTSMDEAVVEEVKNSLVVTADAIHSTYYEHPFELKKNAVVKAIAVMDGPDGTVVSDITTMVYDYEAWMNLREAVMKGVDLYDRAKGNPNVDAQLLEDLQWALNEGDMIYNQRAQMDSFEAKHFTQRINELCAQIEAQMTTEDKPYAVLSADGLTVTFYYDTQKNARGGIDINNSYLQEDMPSPYGTATTAVFDASFANYRPVSTAHWFQHCRSLTSITNIEYLNTVNVTEMTAMFHKCSSLSSLNLSNFNTSNVTDMTAMFGDCSGLTSLDLSNFNTTNVTGMNGMFAGCSGLTNIDLSNFNTTNVMDMSLMFHSCSGLTSLDLSNFNTAKVTNMESMFRYCSELKTIYIGNEWSTNAVEFGSEMFDGCTNLVGGAGTVYDANHTDHTYAHIDGGENNPGYFTDKNPVEASYYDHVLYVGGSVTLAEAMQKFGTNNVVETIAAIVWNSSQAISTSELQVITNPNLLIYVQDASLAPANRDNVVINGFAKNVVLSDVTSGNNNFYCPEEFTAEAISYTRNFQQQTEIGISRGWESIALPFDVQTIMHEKNGVLSPFGSSEGGKPFWLRQMSDNGLVQAIEIHANRPYLISMPNSTDYPAEFNQPGRVTFSSLNVRVPVTEEEAVAMADSTIVLIPTFQRMEQSDWIYALNVGETRAQYPEGSVFEQGLRAVRPFEAFTVHNNNQSNPAPRYIAINEIGNGTLGIDASLVNREEVNSEEWYSLDGRKLQGKPAQKGIYIQNGKKVIIK